MNRRPARGAIGSGANAARAPDGLGTGAGMASAHGIPVKVSAGCKGPGAVTFSINMGRLIWGLVLFSLAGAGYWWMTSEVPGGELRFQHYIRQAQDGAFTFTVGR